MINDYGQMSDDELENAMNSLTKKMLIADSLGKGDTLRLLQTMLDSMREEHKARVEFAQFTIVNEKIPDSYVIGEDDDSDADANEQDEDNTEFYTRRYRRRNN